MKKKKPRGRHYPLTKKDKRFIEQALATQISAVNSIINDHHNLAENCDNITQRLLSLFHDIANKMGNYLSNPSIFPVRVKHLLMFGNAVFLILYAAILKPPGFDSSQCETEGYPHEICHNHLPERVTNFEHFELAIICIYVLAYTGFSVGLRYRLRMLVPPIDSDSGYRLTMFAAHILIYILDMGAISVFISNYLTGSFSLPTISELTYGKMTNDEVDQALIRRLEVYSITSNPYMLIILSIANLIIIHNVIESFAANLLTVDYFLLKLRSWFIRRTFDALCNSYTGDETTLTSVLTYLDFDANDFEQLDLPNESECPVTSSPNLSPLRLKANPKCAPVSMPALLSMMKANKQDQIVHPITRQPVTLKDFVLDRDECRSHIQTIIETVGVWRRSKNRGEEKTSTSTTKPKLGVRCNNS